MGVAENETAMRRIIEDLIDGRRLHIAGELFSDDHVLHPASSGVGRGAEAMKDAFAGLHAEFPDVRVELESMVSGDDLVAVRLTFGGTHAATGERAWWPEMVFTRFAGGKAVESSEVTDTGRSWSERPW